MRRGVCAGLMSPALSSDLEERIGRVLPQIAGGLTAELAAAAARDASREVAVYASADELVVGQVSLPVLPPARPELVPQINFIDNPTHLRLLEAMAADLARTHRT